MAEITIRVCDIDPRPGEEVRHYTVSVDGHVEEMDLCPRHAGPLANVGVPESQRRGRPGRKPGSATRTGSGTPGAGKGRRRVTTLEEIEDMKAEQSEAS